MFYLLFNFICKLFIVVYKISNLTNKKKILNQSKGISVTL